MGVDFRKGFRRVWSRLEIWGNTQWGRASQADAGLEQLGDRLPRGWRSRSQQILRLRIQSRRGGSYHAVGREGRSTLMNLYLLTYDRKLGKLLSIEKFD